MKLNTLQCLFEVGDDVVYVFNAYRETNQVGSYAGFYQLLITQLTVGMACRMQDTGTGICHVGHDTCQLQAIHELHGIFACAFQTESNDTA